MTKSADKATSAKRTQKTEPLTASERFWKEVRGYLEALAVAFLIVTFAFNTVGVVGSSMRPTLDGGSGQLPQALWQGDRVFIPKYATWLRRMGVMDGYQRGDIVVVREPKNAPTALNKTRRSFFIKRVIGVPGDHLYIRQGNVYINGEKLDQGFITDSGEITPYPLDYPVIEQKGGEVTRFRGLIPGTVNPNTGGPADVDNPEVQFFYGSTLDALAPIAQNAPEDTPFLHELIVPQGTYFLMGDNRSNGGSEDSRYFGPIPFMSIAGRASTVIWPPRRSGDWNWRQLPPPAAFERVPEAN